MIYAQIKDGIVQNTIILNSPELEYLFLVGFDHLKRIDELNPVPNKGWVYIEETDSYEAPVPDEE